MQQLNLFGKKEEEKEENRFADKTELSAEERLELARLVYRVFKENIEEIKDIETGKVIYKKEDTPSERAG